MRLRLMNSKALFNQKVLRHKMKRIQSKKHKFGTYEIDKISLSCFDDKGFVLDDGIHALINKKIIQAIRRNQVYFSSSNASTDTTVIVKD